MRRSFHLVHPTVRRRLQRVLLACGVLTCAGLLSAGGAGAAVVADNGFTATANGYSFPNYGEGDGATDLNARQMRRLFGRRVCSAIDENNKCTLTPEAQRWMEATNASMGGGHCFGMASTAQFFFMGIGEPPTPEPFGAPTTPELVFDGNSKLQSHIAYAWTLQLLPAVQNDARPTTPIKVVQRLRNDLKPGDARHVLTIYDQGGGHAITPTSVLNDGGGQWRIAVYDNNWPEETRYVEVDGKANTWTYELAPGHVWSGNAKTKSLGLVRPAVGLGRQPCFICPPKKGKRGANVGKTMRLLWKADSDRGRHGALMIRDAKGNRSGCGAKGCVNRIPGVKMHQVATGAAPAWRHTPPPVFDLPTRKAYRVDIGSTGPKGRPAETVSLIGRGFSVSASGIRLRKGEVDKFLIAKRARHVRFVSGSRKSEKPTIEITSSNVAGGADYKIEIAPAGVNTGAGIGAEFDPDDRVLRLSNHRGDRVERVKLTVTQYGHEQKQFDLEVKVRRGKVKRIPLD
jgi:hypothetical protein